MTKHTHLAFLWTALFSSCFGADQATDVMAREAQPTTAQQPSAAGTTADPSFIPPPTTLISEPNQPLSTPPPEPKPTLPAEQQNQASASAPTVAPEPTLLTLLNTPKPAVLEILKPSTPEPFAKPPLPQPLYEPNQSGVVILPGRTRLSSEEGVANPFEIHLIVAKPLNEVKIRVGGVVMGDKPTAMVNGRPYSATDRWNDFNVVQVQKDALLLERDGVFLLIPRGRDIVIKIPL